MVFAPKKFVLLLLGASFAAAAALGASSAVAADIAINAMASPQGSVVRLGDVAKVTADSAKEATRLAAIPIMPAPAPGTERFLRMREVQDLLSARGEDMDALRFKGELVVDISAPQTSAPQASAAPAPGSTNSDAKTARLNALSTGTAATEAALPSDAAAAQVRDELNRLVIDYLNHSSGQSAAWHVAFSLPGQQLTALPADPSGWKISGGAAPWTGKQRLFVRFNGPHGPDSFVLPTDVSLPMPVAVAIRPLDRGAVVTAADVEIQQRDATGLANGRSVPMASLEKLLGMEVTRSIQVGDVVMSDSVQLPVLVKRGDAVTVYARGGGIQVHTIARARENGSLGQPVQLESLETHKPYDAVVTGTREALVLSAGSPPVATAENDRASAFRK
jgi:flagella basal body P-ring formation protein FlgA